MHDSLREIPSRILEVAIGALTQANEHAVYYDPGMEHWEAMSILNTAQAGELFLKAIIAKEHPLLIFRDLFHLDDASSQEIDIEKIIERGRSYNFEHLPKLLRVVTGECLADLENFETLRRARNSIQHFCAPENISLQRVALEFIYNNLDPLIHKHFNLCAIEYHEDVSVGYDYVVGCLIHHELFFSIPDNFSVGEIDLREELSQTSRVYRDELIRRLAEKGHWREN